MNINRRTFIQSSAAIGALTVGQSASAITNTTVEELAKAASQKILDTTLLSEPVMIESIELLKSGKFYFVRSRSTDGAEGIAVANSKAAFLYPLFQKQVSPYFIGKDARDLETLLDGVYVHASNYKIQSLALWCPVAWIEFSLLDLMGKIANKHVSTFFGGRVRDDIDFYIASGNRDTTAEEEAEILQELTAKHQLKAVKFKVGGRMRNNADSIPGRSEKLIPLVRKTLGDDIVIHADSNGSYDAENGIRIGKMLEDIDAHFFEEPCPFDHLEDTKKVADALTIPIAGGEQESSQRRFRWMIANQAVRIVQPDLHYYGGMIRATRVGKMAAAAGMPITVHMSGGGTGYVDVLNFSSFTPNIGAFQEYKGGLEVTGQWFDPPLQRKDGKIAAPKGPGMGIRHDLDIIRTAKPVS